MKTSSLALTLITIHTLFTSSIVVATECTQAELDAYTTLGGGTAAQEACAGLLKPLGLTKLDASSLGLFTPCNDDKCLAYFEKYAKGLSDCTFQGVMIRQPIDALVSVCKPKGAATSSNDSTTPAANSSSAPTPSTTKSAASTTTTATVVLLLMPLVVVGAMLF